MCQGIVGPLKGAQAQFRLRISVLYGALLTANVAAWVWALSAFGNHPVLLGAAVLAYSLGLRHAVDADHIAAIDNVTRKLMRQNERPATVGLFFSLGHSTIVVLVSLAVVVAASTFKAQIEAFRSVGGVIGTLVSVVFLLAIAAMNAVILLSVYRAFRRVKAGMPYREEDLDSMLAGGGLLAHLLRPLFNSIRRSWHMYLLGFLFGLGFDTATEVALLGISAIQASQGLPVWSILVFPALFTAGMSLVDTSDGIVMVGAYGWAFSNPVRKLYYNLTITFVSVAVALVVSGIEVFSLIQQHFALNGPFWDAVRVLNGNWGMIGYLIVGIFIGTWTIAALIYRLRGYDKLQVNTG